MYRQRCLTCKRLFIRSIAEKKRNTIVFVSQVEITITGCQSRYYAYYNCVLLRERNHKLDVGRKQSRFFGLATHRKCVIAFLTREAWAQKQTMSLARSKRRISPRQRPRQRFHGTFNPFFEVNVMLLRCSKMCYIEA